MKFFHYGKDGGDESTVWGFFFIEIKSLFSIVLLRFENGSRDAYHSHAFNCFSWVLRGRLYEEHHRSRPPRTYLPSWMPFVTRRDTFHKVTSAGTTWVLTFRGPWATGWAEYIPTEDRYVWLTDGRTEAWRSL